jgi:hypothetical protein
MKKQTLVAFALLLLIPVVMMGGSFVSSLINPEIAAGHPNYSPNFQLLNMAKVSTLFASVAICGVLWLIVCFLLIRSKQRSLGWMVLAAFGPFGLAVLATLNDRVPATTDRYASFVHGLRWPIRIAYEAASFVVLCFLAYQAMLIQRYLIILYQSATSGLSTAQIIDQQNASSGMWAFGEALEVLFFLALFYVLRPILFNLLSRLFTTSVPAPITSPKPR